MKTYSIKEISQMFEIPSSTLRYYEDMGLLEHVGRDKNNIRIYTDEHIQRLHAIHCFKRTGLPIAKMQDFFHYESDIPGHIDDIINLVTEHEQDIISQVKKMQTDLMHIEHKVRYYTGIKSALENHTPFPLWEDFDM